MRAVGEAVDARREGEAVHVRVVGEMPRVPGIGHEQIERVHRFRCGGIVPGQPIGYQRPARGKLGPWIAFDAQVGDEGETARRVDPQPRSARLQVTSGDRTIRPARKRRGRAFVKLVAIADHDKAPARMRTEGGSGDAHQIRPFAFRLTWPCRPMIT